MCFGFNFPLLQLALTQSLAALGQALNQLVPGLREKIQNSSRRLSNQFWQYQDFGNIWPINPSLSRTKKMWPTADGKQSGYDDDDD